LDNDGAVTAANGLAMQELGARIRVLAIARGDGGDLEYPPRRDTRRAADDRASLLGPYEQLLRVLGRERAEAAA
jgi:Trk K+ transport system NAD-binding subunit